MSSLIVVSAPSGAGKTTLCHRVLRDFPTVTLSVSSTTRQPRGQEKDGVEYHFLSKTEFETQIQAGQFAEWAQVHGNYYGTSRKVIDEAFAQGKSVLLDIDVQGAAQLKKAYPKNCYQIFIAPPSLEELELRLRSRGTEAEESIQKRLTNAKTEIAESKKFDIVIVNDSLDRAYQELKGILQTVLHLSVR